MFALLNLRNTPQASTDQSIGCWLTGKRLKQRTKTRSYEKFQTKTSQEKTEESILLQQELKDLSTGYTVRIESDRDQWENIWVKKQTRNIWGNEIKWNEIEKKCIHFNTERGVEYELSELDRWHQEQ